MMTWENPKTWKTGDVAGKDVMDTTVRDSNYVQNVINTEGFKDIKSGDVMVIERVSRSIDGQLVLYVRLNNNATYGLLVSQVDFAYYEPYKIPESLKDGE